MACLTSLPSLATSPLPGPAEFRRLHDVIQENPFPTAPTQSVLPSMSTSLSTTNGIDMEAAKKTRFILNSIVIKGMHAYKPQQFMPLFDNLTGQETSVAKLFEIVEKITTTYRNDGYILARAIIPPQDVTEGHVRIDIIEGHINDVQLTGNPVITKSPLINEYVHKLKEEQPTAANIERNLLLINDLPGVRASSTLTPGDAPESADIIVNLEKQDITGSIGWSNWGTRYIGPNQLEGNLVINNLTYPLFDKHDKLEINAIQTTALRELSYIDMTETLPIGNNGTTLELNGYFSRSEPGYTLEPLGVINRNVGGYIKLNQPLIRSRATNTNTYAMFDMTHAKSRSLGAILTEDKLRVARVGFNAQHYDQFNGISELEFQISRGLPIMAATADNDLLKSRADGVASGFTKYNLSLSRLQNLNPYWNILTEAAGQFSSNALLASEEFGLGGQRYGRGYDTSELSGDQGVAGKVELQANFAPRNKVLDAWQLFGFYEVGAVWNKDNLALNGENMETLASVGYGVRSQFANKWDIDFTLALPISRPVLTQGGTNTNPSAYVRVKKNFATDWKKMPWQADTIYQP